MSERTPKRRLGSSVNTNEVRDLHPTIRVMADANAKRERALRFIAENIKICKVIACYHFGICRIDLLKGEGFAVNNITLNSKSSYGIY